MIDKYPRPWRYTDEGGIAYLYDANGQALGAIKLSLAPTVCAMGEMIDKIDGWASALEHLYPVDERIIDQMINDFSSAMAKARGGQGQEPVGKGAYRKPECRNCARFLQCRSMGVLEEWAPACPHFEKAKARGEG